MHSHKWMKLTDWAFPPDSTMDVIASDGNGRDQVTPSPSSMTALRLSKPTRPVKGCRACVESGEATSSLCKSVSSCRLVWKPPPAPTHPPTPSRLRFLQQWW